MIFSWFCHCKNGCRESNKEKKLDLNSFSYCLSLCQLKSLYLPTATLLNFAQLSFVFLFSFFTCDLIMLEIEEFALSIFVSDGQQVNCLKTMFYANSLGFQTCLHTPWEAMI